jgi:enamine deaminase RidA (YjgF/YER057c/UK114 family)
VQTFENLKTALAAVGAQFRHVVKFNNYLVDRAHLPTFREVRDGYLAENDRPASTTIAISGLAREGALIEIEAVAVLPAAARAKAASKGASKRAGAGRKRPPATRASRSRRK